MLNPNIKIMATSEVIDLNATSDNSVSETDDAGNEKVSQHIFAKLCILKC